MVRDPNSAALYVKITPAGVVTTLVGGVSSDGFVLPNFYPVNLAVDANGTVYLTDEVSVITLLLNGSPGLNGTVTGSIPPANPRQSCN